MANPKTNKIKTECCGHEFETEWTLLNVSNATTDCPNCGELLIFPKYGHEIRAYKFHQYMHDISVENNPDAKMHWPADGANTGYVEI